MLIVHGFLKVDSRDRTRYYHGITYMTYKSTAVIHREGKWFVARSLELGVTTQGKTIEEAQKNLQEAVTLFLEDMPKARKTLTKTSPFVTSIEVGRG